MRFPALGRTTLPVFRGLKSGESRKLYNGQFCIGYRFDEGPTFKTLQNPFALANLPSMDVNPNSGVELYVKLKMTVII